MLIVDPADVAIEIDVIHSHGTLEQARTKADPREMPTALVLHDDRDAAARLLGALGAVALVKTDRLSCAWVPRAPLIRALETIEPLEAIRLAQMPPTDVRVWTVVHAARACRVARYGAKDPRARAVKRAAEKEMLGIVYTRCCDPTCVDDGGHAWDEREIVDEAGEPVDDTTCTLCGMPEDLYISWSAWGFGRPRVKEKAEVPFQS